MNDPIYDFDCGSFLFSVSDSVAMDTEGNLHMKVAPNLALDMATGQMHLTTPWPFGEDDREEDGR